jgi:hypothetical protein
MPVPRLIRCGKCHVVMGLRHFVLKHRRPNGVDCPRVPCVICQKPVGTEGYTAWGSAVCSEECQCNYPETRAAKKECREVWEQLDAIERAKRLPPVYQRRRAS